LSIVNSAYKKKGQNLAKAYAKAIFYHTRQVAAGVAKLVLGCILDLSLGEGSKGVSEDTIPKSVGGFL